MIGSEEQNDANTSRIFCVSVGSAAVASGEWGNFKNKATVSDLLAPHIKAGSL